MKEIDARGLACPAPVLQTKATLQEGRPRQVKVVLDNAASQQNVQRFLESQGFQTTLEQIGDDYLVLGTSDSEALSRAEVSKAEVSKAEASDAEVSDAEVAEAPLSGDGEGEKIMVMCATDRMGHGDDELGRKLMVNYLRTLGEMGPELWRLILVNNGVKLAIDGSEVLEDLKGYEAGGLKILVCGTCLDHFKLLERKQVGETTNMLDIVTAMQAADKVINF